MKWLLNNLRDASFYKAVSSEAALFFLFLRHDHEKYGKTGPVAKAAEIPEGAAVLRCGRPQDGGRALAVGF